MPFLGSTTCLRRGFVLPLLVIWAWGSTVAVQAGESYTLSPSSPGATQAEARIQVSGELKLLVTVDAADGGKSRQQSTRIPVAVTAELRYHNRPLDGQNERGAATSLLQHAIRRYETAEAKMRVGKGEIVRQLAPERRTIVAHETRDATHLFSPSDPLEQSERDLLLIACDSGLLHHFLPSEAVQLHSHWQPADDVLARLLRLEVVNQSSVQVTLSRVDKNLAILDIAGKVSGGVEGVTSELELLGKLNYDLEKQLCTWLAIDLKENRAPSEGTPGFETTSRIRVAVAPSDVPAELTDAVVRDLKTQPDEATQLLRFAASLQGFALVYEPQWRIVSDQPNLAVLRYLDQGEMLAQCNISRLTPLAAGEQLTLEGFQRDLKQSLEKTFGEFLEASESVNEGGLRVLRVVVAASVSEVPIQYVFYHLSDDQQNRVSLAFTMDSERVERFGRADETLVSSFTFTERAEPVSPEAKAGVTGTGNSTKSTQQATTPSRTTTRK
jgi:hypothetical protein